MSRSNPQSSTSPITRRFEWKGGEGKVQYYDKETSSNVEVNMPFTFIPLDDRNGFTGWSESAGSGIWSNHIKNFNETIIARSKKGVIASGLYSDIKDTVSKQGGKYAAFVYIAYKDEEKLKIGVMEFKGIAANAWITFKAENDINSIAVVIKEGLQGKKGAITFFSPVFTASKIADQTNAEAIELDKQLQSYFSTPKDGFVEEETFEAPKQVNQDFFSEDEDESSDLPF